MEKRDIISLLYTIYSAGFVHGSNEGSFPEWYNKLTNNQIFYFNIDYEKSK